MKEEYLHYSFKRKMFGNEFVTAEKKTLKVLDFGEHNQNAGPDFLDAKISYDNKVWVGAIEFHVKSSDWYRHKHQFDPAYENVIAHFVYENDAQVISKNYLLSTVELKGHVNGEHYKKYKGLIKSKAEILCQAGLSKIDNATIEIEKENRMKERLWKKSLKIIEDIETHKGNRTKGYLRAIARTFGGTVNQLPFEQLVDKVNMNWFAKLNYDMQRVEALLFGLANLLPEKTDDTYVQKMMDEFEYQKVLFNISHKNELGWKYSRMRPYNFPDLRLAQFIAFSNSGNSLSDLLEKDWTIEEFYDGAKIKLNSFWERHYKINNLSKAKVSTELSESMLDLILINAVIPFIYAIGLWEGNNTYKLKALSYLKQIKGERNNTILIWKSAGVKIDSAFDSQSLLELKKEGCNRKKCLFCAIGKKILNR